MPGLLAFHAHPDDEVTSTGGVLAKYSQSGEQVAVVTATDGAEGEIHNYEDPDELRPRLVELRAEEIAKALAILGVPNHHFLGYRDSGMMGTDPNRHPGSFWQADFMDATARLVHLIRRYTPEVLTIYDPFGGYGHPDHIQVHRVGLAAYFGTDDVRRFPLEEGEEPWRVTKLYMSTWPRSRVAAMTAARRRAGLITEEEAKESEGWGTPDGGHHRPGRCDRLGGPQSGGPASPSFPDPRRLVHAPGTRRGHARRARYRGLPAAVFAGARSLPRG